MKENMSVTLPLTPAQITALRRALLRWGTQHFRVFPWRQTTDPYRILIAEILLHRTQVKQVVPVYQSFVKRYPDIMALAQANLTEVQALLYPLGLHWRVELIYKMAQEIQTKYGGEIPRSRDDLLSLPGVSEYIAGAVRCFAWNFPEALLDTNTIRVTGRLLGIPVRDSLRRNRGFRMVVESLIDRASPRKYNYALLDLAATVCRKRGQPHCEQCPLSEWCLYADKSR